MQPKSKRKPPADVPYEAEDLQRTTCVKIEIDARTRNEFSAICRRRGLSMAARVRAMMQEDIMRATAAVPATAATC